MFRSTRGATARLLGTVGVVGILGVGCAAGEDGEPPAPNWGGAGGDAGDAGTGGAAGVGTGGDAGTGAQGGTSPAGSGGTNAGGTAGAGGLTCDQIDQESNDNEATANDLGSVTDCDGEGGTIVGTLAPGDQDWFTFFAEDVAFCSVNPTFTVTSADNVTVCAHFACSSGSTEVDCDDPATPKTSTGGVDGCCSSITPLSGSVNCTGTMGDDTQVLVQVAWPGNSECKNYSVDYHY